MTVVSPRRKPSAYTLIEIVVVVATLALLLFLFAVKLPQQRRQARRLECVSNLKQMGTAFRMWGNDSGSGTPMSIVPFTNDVSFYSKAFADQMSSSKILACPDDTRTASATFSKLQNQNISYFLGMDAEDTMPGTILWGDRSITLAPTPQTNLWELGTNKSVGWSQLLHNGDGNIGFADGSVKLLDEKTLQLALEATGDTTNRILLPFSNP
ncbi:MAG: hypothetical protein JWM68_3449 [Verrucomicrobiales bacterium]|nr:hypothetical protein [Verrucomicrobiales bacterium]